MLESEQICKHKFVPTNKEINYIEGRDKARDDEFFNWNQDYEIDYVADRYGIHKAEVKAFLHFYKGLHEGEGLSMTHEEL